MKPVSVRFQCFGPYKEEMFVDFETLEKNGLFLICGETGAGKTTILDAICYALYGKSSGGNRGDLSVMRCKMAEPSDETVVEFTFDTNGKRYRFVRTLRFGRKNLIDFHNCMVRENGNYVPLFENPKLKNVNQKAEELVGLNHEQFSQVIILPQGQFEKLLVSDSVEKEKILVSLFKAEKWQNIAEEMYRRVSEEDRKLRGEIADIKSRLSDYNCNKIEELEELFKLEEVQLKELAEAVKESEQQETAQKERYEKAIRIQEQTEELEKRRRNVERLNNQKVQMQKLQGVLKKADLADEIRQDYEAFCGARKAWEEAEQKEKQNQKRVCAAEEILEKVQEKKNAHEAGKPAYEAGVHRLAMLEGARKLYASLEQRKKEADKAMQEYLLSQKHLDKAKKDFDKKHQFWMAKMEAQREKMDRYTSAQKVYLEGISGTLAEKLKVGEPCPVCGSLTHPSPATHTGQKVTESELDIYHQEMLHAGSEVEKAASERAEAEQIYQNRQIEAMEAGQRAAAFKTAYEEILRQKIEGMETTEELEAGIKDLRQRIEKYKELTTRFQNMLMEAQANIKACEEALKQSSKERKTAKETLDEKMASWEVLYRQTGFESEEAFVSSLMRTEEKNRQKEVFIRFQTELEAAWKAWEEQKKAVDDGQTPDVRAEKHKLSELTDRQKKISKEWILKQQSLEKMQKDLHNFSKRKEKYDAQRSKVDADLEFVNRLRGRTGISLQRYVLRVMLSSITAEANRLLKNVHGGRYQLYRTDAIAGSGHKGGLELEVLDAQSNERRSVTTLSGGEKFLVALSLAIGLSTVVQAQGNGMRLGAMFIDEGFGSLDQNSIYDALEVLQGIQKANGLVGIISHVELLRDVIPSKIEVHKSKNGSKLHIV